LSTKIKSQAQLYQPLSLPAGGKRWGGGLVKLVGTGLLLLFIWKLNLNLAQITTSLFQANLWLVLLSALLILPILALKSWRWRIIVETSGLKLSYGSAFYLYALGLSAGSFTPGQAGDAIKAWKLKESGYPFPTALKSIILDRLFDLLVLAILAIGSIVFLSSTFLNELAGSLLLLALVAALLLIITFPKLYQPLLALLAKLIERKTGKYGTGEVAPTTYNPPQKLKSFISPFLITLSTSSLAIFRVWLLAMALGLNLGLPEAVAVSSLGTVAGLLPVSVAGIGTRDLTLIGILNKLGYLRETAVSLSALVLLLSLVNLVVGYTIWSTRPKSSREQANNGWNHANNSNLESTKE